MWVVIGTKEKTERVPGGRQVERHCSECGETAMFYERRATSTLQLYFLNVYEFKSRHVMACGACGALYATDEVSSPADETKGEGIDAFVATAERVGGALASGATKALNRVQAAAREAFSGGEHLPARAAPPADDPLAEDDEALEARFRELERKIRIADD
ncbi:hypothetical protein AKJ09_00701 [Labilithrix luteola]|uniref:Uncharacterized protein n=1 Tax=Labilithrix luteola TaxID=1391654 RepID=A0A0K1PKJ1_9BACT|nr:hypothetical protein [Labilithrix luteola]AKU94037.1 hypothetical protein AKJ09_00701 [Labilithrix luteola]